MEPWKLRGTPPYEEAVQRLIGKGASKVAAEVRLDAMLLVSPKLLQRMIASNAWSDPRNYYAAEEALKLKLLQGA